MKDGSGPRAKGCAVRLSPGIVADGPVSDRMRNKRGAGPSYQHTVPTAVGQKHCAILNAAEDPRLFGAAAEIVRCRDGGPARGGTAPGACCFEISRPSSASTFTLRAIWSTELQNETSARMHNCRCVAGLVLTAHPRVPSPPPVFFPPKVPAQSRSHEALLAQPDVRIQPEMN